jgi:bacterioferritin
MADGNDVSREHLAELLNEDLAREYQAIIGYVVYSQVLSGAQYMDIAAQLEIHAKQELDHALIISRQIDYLGKMPAVTPKQVRTSKDAKEMLRFDLENENSPDPCRGAGPSNRSSHSARRRSSGRQR